MSNDTPFWRKALGTVIHLDDAPAAATAQPATAAVALRTAVPATSNVIILDQILHDELMRAALSRKTTFSGLIESAERLRAVTGMDDTQRIKAAAAMAGSVTIEMITQAASGHIGDIALERSKFGREITGAKASRVHTVIAQATSLESQIKTANDEIQRLNGHISTLTERVSELRASGTAAEAEITQTAATFEATAAQVEQFIISTRDAIVSALK